MINYDFSGRKVLVTGGSRGIGLGVAEGFIQSGGDVTILASSSETTKVASKLSESTGASLLHWFATSQIGTPWHRRLVDWSELIYWSTMPGWN
jgi:NAD(P)-dependent dehydrogenase (short-subunit alcohol dehydrogenase family)